jgi:AraC family cel operon transcriptional repressor
VARELHLRRISYACELLRDSQKSVREIALKCGFSNVDYFSAAFRRTRGTTPLAYRRAHTTPHDPKRRKL